MKLILNFYFHVPIKLCRFSKYRFRPYDAIPSRDRRLREIRRKRRRLSSERRRRAKATAIECKVVAINVLSYFAEIASVFPTLTLSIMHLFEWPHLEIGSFQEVKTTELRSEKMIRDLIAKALRSTLR